MVSSDGCRAIENASAKTAACTPSEIASEPVDRSITATRYRSVNAMAIVTSTGTGSPSRVPGAKRHWRAALIAS